MAKCSLVGDPNVISLFHEGLNGLLVLARGSRHCRMGSGILMYLAVDCTHKLELCAVIHYCCLGGNFLQEGAVVFLPVRIIQSCFFLLFQHRPCCLA